MERRDRTAFAHLLVVSGLLGIAAASSVAVYQALLADPVLLDGQQRVPDWTAGVFATLLGGSLAVLFYALVLDDVLEGWFDVVTGAAVLAQWGLPVGRLLTRSGASSGPAAILVLASGVLHMLVALAVLGNYLRRVWPLGDVSI